MVCLLIFPAHVAEKEGNWEYLCGGDNSSDPLDSWSDNGYKRPLPIWCMGETSDTSFFAKREQRRTVIQCSVSHLGAVQMQQVLYAWLTFILTHFREDAARRRSNVQKPPHLEMPSGAGVLTL